MPTNLWLANTWGGGRSLQQHSGGCGPRWCPIFWSAARKVTCVGCANTIICGLFSMLFIIILPWRSVLRIEWYFRSYSTSPVLRGSHLSAQANKLNVDWKVSAPGGAARTPEKGCRGKDLFDCHVCHSQGGHTAFWCPAGSTWTTVRRRNNVGCEPLEH